MTGAPRLTTANPVAEARALAPRALETPWLPWLGRRLAWAAFALAMGLLLWDLGLTPETFLAGLAQIGKIFAAMVPPTAAGQESRFLHALLETLAMAFVATLIAVIVAIPLGLLGARTIVSNPVLHFTIRRIYDFFRGIPSLVWALILISAFGLGPFAGVLAIVLAEAPYLAKIYAEAIENIDGKQTESVKSVGAGWLVSLRYGGLPQVLPIIASLALFLLEVNVRGAAALGIVGAGGIGFELEERIRLFLFDQVAYILILYIVLVAALDFVSGRLRARLTD